MASIQLQFSNGASVSLNQEPAPVVSIQNGSAPVVSIQNGNVQAGGTANGMGSKFDAHFKKNFTNLMWNNLGNGNYEQTIVHNLDKKGAVQVFDNYDNLLIVNVDHIDTNSVKLTTSSIFSGKIYIN